MPIPDDTHYLTVDPEWLTGAALALATPVPNVVDFTRHTTWTPCTRCGISFTQPARQHAGPLRSLCYDCSPRGHAPAPAADYSLVVELSRTRAALELVKRQLRMGRPKREILAVIEAV